MQPLKELTLLYSLKVPSRINESSRYPSETNNYFVIRYETLTPFQIGEILHFDTDRSCYESKVSFQVEQIVRAYENLTTLKNIPNHIYHVYERGHNLLLFHAFGKRLPDASRITY